jgi:hypothetical protein
MTIGTGHGGPEFLPRSLAVAWLLVFVAILVAHSRHLISTRGQRRAWHGGHVLMALGMVSMYAPAAIGRLGIPGRLGQLAALYAAGLTLAWVLARLLDSGQANLLWLLTALDLAAMAERWSPDRVSAPLTWLLVSYFAVQAALWGVSAHRQIEGRWQLVAPAEISAPTNDGAVAISGARSEPLICELKLRPSMIAMTAGMAYMLIAMQLMH